MDAFQQALKQKKRVKIIFSGNPISTNAVYKRGRGNSFYMTTEAKSRKEQYQWEIKKQYKGKPLTGHLGVLVNLYFQDKRKHDLDNYNKLVFDACNELLWEDDAQIASLYIFKCPPLFSKNKSPRIELEAWEA